MDEDLDDSLVVSRDTIRNLVKAVMSVARPQSVDDSDMSACYLDDISVVFLKTSGKNSLYGVTVSVLGREFHLLADGQVALVEDNDDDAPIYVVEDDNIVSFLEDFLKLRTDLILTFGA